MGTRASEAPSTINEGTATHDRPSRPDGVDDVGPPKSGHCNAGAADEGAGEQPDPYTPPRVDMARARRRKGTTAATYACLAWTAALAGRSATI
jgi:hypothetical protein